MKQLLLGLLVLANVSWAMAQDCRVPVCNINAKIEEMAAMTQDGRFAIVNEMKAKYKTETNPEVLVNLVEFAERAIALMTEKGDEAYVLREPEYMKNAAIQSLVKYDKINKDLMIERFSKVTGETAAFDILTYWAVEVEKLDDIKEVLQVTGFAEYAKQWAIDTKQEAYVVREADRILIVGGKRVSTLNPFHEGAYKVKIKCLPTPKDCGDMPKIITHMSVFDSLTTQGLIVNLADSQMSAPLYIYTSSLLTNNGSHIRGISTDATPTTRISEIDLDVDMMTGKITGRLIDPAFIGEMIIEGTPVRRMSEFYTDKGPSRITDVKNILGAYKGTLAGIDGSTLVISQYSSGELMAVMNIGTGTNLNFRSGSYNSKSGVLSFVGNGGAMGMRKLVLALRKDSKGREQLTGFMLTATPKTPEAVFYKDAK